MGAINQRLAAGCFNNTRKGYLLLRVYSGERVADEVAWEVANVCELRSRNRRTFDDMNVTRGGKR
jgi:hypothetical protein